MVMGRVDRFPPLGRAMWALAEWAWCGRVHVLLGKFTGDFVFSFPTLMTKLLVVVPSLIPTRTGHRGADGLFHGPEVREGSQL